MGSVHISAITDCFLGSITFAWSLFVIFVLPATPMEAIFLSKEEKYHLVKRVATNKTGVANKEWKWSQVKEAFIDPKTCNWAQILVAASMN